MKVLTALAVTAFLFGRCPSDMTFAAPDSGTPGIVRCPGGCRGGEPPGRLYDPKTVETVSGEIVSLDKIAGPAGRGRVHATLKTDKGETVSVHLGPAWYVDNQSVTIKQGDKATVRGSRVGVDGKPVIIAAEVTKDGQTLRLRDDNGLPLWAGGRKAGR
jgi:hypothetical protein